MSYTKLIINTNAEEAEILSDLLTDLGALSVSMQDAADEAVFQLEPGESPLWKHTKLEALFNDSTSTKLAINRLKKQEPNLIKNDFYMETLEDQDWVRITQQHFHPQKHGKDLWVCPAWSDVSELSGTIVKIDPGLAFGTGTHPTTSLCLEWLANHPPTNKTVIDYGCGSGILSLAALALDARKVWAIDHDPQALTATHSNAKLNDYDHADKLAVLTPKECKNISADIMIANILANPLIELAPKLVALIKPGGQLVLSGLLENEIERVCDAYHGLMTVATTQVNHGWGLIELTEINPSDRLLTE